MKPALLILSILFAAPIAQAANLGANESAMASVILTQAGYAPKGHRDLQTVKITCVVPKNSETGNPFCDGQDLNVEGAEDPGKSLGEGTLSKALSGLLSLAGVSPKGHRDLQQAEITCVVPKTSETGLPECSVDGINE